MKLIYIFIAFAFLINSYGARSSELKIAPANPSHLIITEYSQHPLALDNPNAVGWALAQSNENINFPGYEKANRVIKFDFIVSKEILEKEHIAIHINMSNDTTRGILIGNIHQRQDGKGCLKHPSVQIESFNFGDVYLNHNKCTPLYVDTKNPLIYNYHIEMTISKYVIAYKLSDKYGRLIESDAVDSSLHLKSELGGVFHQVPDIGFVYTGAKRVHGFLEITNLESGYYKIN